MSRPWIADQTTEAIAAVVLVVVGFALLYDAYEGRGGSAPRWMGPFKPW